MAEKKVKRESRNAVIIWVALLAALVYSSNAMMATFNSLFQAIFQRLGSLGGTLFSDRPTAAMFFLGVVLVILLVNAWRNLVSMTFELVLAFSGKLEGSAFEGLLNFSSDDEDSLPTSSLPSAVLRDLAIVWGLFFLIFLLLPVVLSS